MFTRKYYGCAVAVVIAMSATGCGTSTDSGGGGAANMDEMAAQLDAQESARQQQEARAAAAKSAEEEAAAKAAAAAPPDVREVTARSPKRGQSLQGGGYLSVVTGTRFWAEHQLILDNIRHAVDLFEATNSRFPKDQDEFMREIIHANDIRLPELPEGWEYFYDPQEPRVLKMKNTGTGDASAVQ